MSFTYYIDSSFNDFRVKDGQLVFARGEYVIIQQIRTALQVELGEWFLNTQTGIPYYSANGTLNDNTNPGIFGGKISAAELSAYLRKAILQVPQVIKINTFLLTETVNRTVQIESQVLVETNTVNGIGFQTVVNINLEL